jgi:transcriptional regulator with XRE-family HTH domain
LDWRELLGDIINNVAERDRIANEIGVHPVTLTRWVSGDSSPRAHNLRQLLRALPKPQRTQLLSSLEKVSSDVADFEIDVSAQEIPYKFIMEVLEARANIPDLLRYWSISHLVLQQALRQLDPERVGMAITIVRCMPPRNGKIRSLRESLGMGTSPWAGDLEEKALLLGAESLAGHVTVSCRMEQIGDLHANRTFLPAYQTEHEVSAVACPIMYACRTAGCLLISSTQTDYFAPEARLSLIRAYANLAALGFNQDEFYDPEALALHIMPPLDVQQTYFTGFRQRVLQVMQASVKANKRLSSPEAEQIVWQEIEDALLQ